MQNEYIISKLIELTNRVILLSKKVDELLEIARGE